MKLDIVRIVNYCSIVHVDPHHLKSAQWMACLMSIQAMQELGYFCVSGTDPYIMGLRIIMLRLEVKLADECQKNRPCHQ